MPSYHLHPYMYQQEREIQLVELVYASNEKKIFDYLNDSFQSIFVTINVYSMVVYCGESSAG